MSMMKTVFALPVILITIMPFAGKAQAPAASVSEASVSEKANKLVEKALRGCPKAADEGLSKQIRDLLMIKARAVSDNNRALMQNEKNIAQGMNGVIRDEILGIDNDPYGCVMNGDGPLANWVESIFWADADIGAEFDPIKEADRIARICTWATTPPSQRDRFLSNVDKILQVRFTAKSENRSTTDAEKKRIEASRKVLRGLDDKSQKAVVECLVETTRDTIAPWPALKK